MWATSAAPRREHVEVFRPLPPVAGRSSVGVVTGGCRWPESRFKVVFVMATFFAGVFLAGLAIAGSASGSPSCTNVNRTTTVCQNPGNTQISTSPGTVATPYGGWPFWGGWGGGLIISIGGGR